MTKLFSSFLLTLSPDLVYFNKDGKALRSPKILASSCPWGWECVGFFAQGKVPLEKGI